jgi:hypothetical protein
VDDELSEDALEQIAGGAGVGLPEGPSKVAQEKKNVANIKWAPGPLPPAKVK